MSINRSPAKLQKFDKEDREPRSSSVTARSTGHGCGAGGRWTSTRTSSFTTRTTRRRRIRLPRRIIGTRAWATCNRSRGRRRCNWRRPPPCTTSRSTRPRTGESALSISDVVDVALTRIVQVIDLFASPFWAKEKRHRLCDLAGAVRGN